MIHVKQGKFGLDLRWKFEIVNLLKYHIVTLQTKKIYLEKCFSPAFNDFLIFKNTFICLDNQPPPYKPEMFLSKVIQL